MLDLAPVSRECTVSGLESILAFRSENKHGIMRLHCDDRTSRRVPEWT